MLQFNLSFLSPFKEFSVTDTATYLKETREKRGLSLDDVEQATRIPRHYLEMMEGEGDTRLISDPLYLVHYVRRYAAYLEIDEAEQLAAQFIRENTRLQGAKRTRAPRKEEASPRLFPWILGLIAVVGLGAAYMFDSSLLTGILGKEAAEETGTRAPARTQDEVAPSPLLDRIEPAPTVRMEPPTEPMTVLQPEAKEIVPPPVTRPEETSIAIGETTASTTETDATALESTVENSGTPPEGRDAPGAEDLARTTEPATTSPAETDDQRLEIAAKEKAWVRVIVDGQPPQDMMMEPGDTRTWSAQEQFVLTFGNAGGVDLTFNGKKLPPLGTSGQVIRNYQLPR